MHLAYKMNMFYTFFSTKSLVFASLVSDFLTTQTKNKKIFTSSILII